MSQIVLAGISGLVAFELFLRLDLPFPVAVFCFLGLFVFLNLVVNGLVRGIWNSGLWTTLPLRRLVGLTADGIIYLVLAVPVWWLFDQYQVNVWVWNIAWHIDRWLHNGTAAWPPNVAIVLWLWLIVLGFLLRYFLLARPLKVVIGRIVLPVSRLLRSRFIGMGGSSQFGGLFNDWAHPWKPGQLILGGSMYSPGWKVGRSDDRHFITIATSRSGKGRSGIIPNLLTWPGSALVIDPKGQNAAVTAVARGSGGGRVKKGMGQTVRIVDPFGELKAQGVALPVHRFNPLAEIDPAALDAVEQIRRVTDALVMPDPTGAKDFWDRSASNVISGVIAHVLTGEGGSPEKRTLYGVRDLLKNIGNESLRESMAGNGAVGGLAQAAVATLENAGENAEGDIIATALSHTDWLDSLAMADALATSEFSLSELKATTATVYLVLPPQYLDVHGRFLRLFVNLALQEVGRGRKPRYPVLMVLDEFYALGRMQFVAKAAGLMAGFGVKLWPIVQNLSQLAELYPDNWETFLGNAGMWQVFAVNDQTTARYMSERLGEHIVWRKQRTFDQEKQKYIEEWTPQGASFLRTGIELGRETSRDSGNQVIFVEGSDSFLLRRRPYDRTFKREQYSPDPSEPRASTLRGRLKDWYEGFEQRLDAKGKAWQAQIEWRLDEWDERRARQKAEKRAGRTTNKSQDARGG